ncbi:MAG TPA: hypothetical protein VGI26_07245 [Solirubrobacteraceae bacterium]
MALLVSLMCLAAASAFASYEQIGTFDGTPGVLYEHEYEAPKDVQLTSSNGLAVNYTGAGGVPAGTIYSVNQPLGEEYVARFNPGGSFSEEWGADGSPPSVRCGPEGVPAEPICVSHAVKSVAGLGIGVDESTGYVYVLWKVSKGTGSGYDQIKVYSADGSEVITEFGEQAPFGQTVPEGPEELHDDGGTGNQLAVDAAGDVYVVDSTGSVENFRHRVMKFEPQTAGNYEHYIYSGLSNDIAAGNSLEGFTHVPDSPTLDAHGHIYVADENHITELDVSSPSAAPLCEFTFSRGGILSLAVNPETEEVFFYENKTRSVRRLRPCSDGGFAEVGSVPVSPSRQRMVLAFDPAHSAGVGRPNGILYGAAPNGSGGAEGTLGGEVSLGYVFAPARELPPIVDSESVSHVTSGSAVLSAQINPQSVATRFSFQYVTQAQYEEHEAEEPFVGAIEAPLGGGSAGEGKGAVAVSASLAGLAPDTSYRYRVVASSHCSAGEPEKVCSATGETRDFHTFEAHTASVLPDARVYELVSPPLKHGGQVFPVDPEIGSCRGPYGGPCKPGVRLGSYPQLSAAGGEAVVYRGSPFSAVEGSVGAQQYIARRDPTRGWSTSDATPLGMEGTVAEGYQALSEDLTHGLIFQRTTVLAGAPEGYANLYMQPTGDPTSLAPLVGPAPPDRAPGTGTFVVRYAGASADLSRVFFEATDALTGEVSGVAPPAVDGGAGESNLYEWHEGTLSLVNVLPGNEITEPGSSFGDGDSHVISTDGSRAFFSGPSGQVYIREDALATREIETEGTPDPGRFVAAAADGSEVLLANGHLHGLGDEEPTVDLTGGKGGFLGLTGQSEDLSHIYFVDTAVLTGEEENEHCAAVAGKDVCETATEGADNLYSWTQGGGARFIGKLSTHDQATAVFYDAQDWSRSAALRTARASADGRFLAFLSVAPLTGYDNNAGPCEGPCPEVFLYDSATGKLRCASCNPSGEQPLGWSALARVAGPPTLPLAHYLTNEGRLFFDTTDSLLPADTNGGAEDVYEYEPDGVGGCRESSGCVSLISTGTGTNDSNFFGADAGGANAFFTTYSRLSPRDTDESIDLYDARSGGGLAVDTVAPTPECHGELCQPPASLLLGPTTPASLSFQGAGDSVTSGPAVTAKRTGAKKPKAKKPKAKKRKRKAGKRRASRSTKRTVKQKKGRGQ